MNSFISWIGGKKSLRDDILARLPPEYDKYIEVFGGAGWVLFRKPQDRKVEVYNDFNSNLVNLFRCVRDKPNKLKYKSRYVLNSREDFDWIATLHKKSCSQDFVTLTGQPSFFSLSDTAMHRDWTVLAVSRIQCGRIFRRLIWLQCGFKRC